MNKTAIEAFVRELGYASLYEESGAFRERFAEMCLAVARLPAHLLDKGRQLGYPQLHIACLQGDLDLVKALLVAGLSADAYTFTNDEDDEPPLVWIGREEAMSAQEKIKVAKVLLGHGADVNEGNALEAAEDSGDDEFADFLRDAGAE